MNKQKLSLAIQPQTLLLLERLAVFLRKMGIKSYVVGGLVRDALLGRDSADIDIAVAADGFETARAVAAALSGSYVPLDEQNRIGRVVLPNREKPDQPCWMLDFSTLQGNIEEDLSRRDFTVDAMSFALEDLAWHDKDAHLIDPFRGYDDLSQGVLRATGENIFTTDAARLIRAVRFVAELGFTMDKETEAQVMRHTDLIKSVAGERLRGELLHILAIPQSEKLLVYMDNLGLLTAIIPELVFTKGVTQPKEHFWNVFDHSIKTVAAVDFLLRRGIWEYTKRVVLSFVPWSEEIRQHFNLQVSPGSNRRILLKLAALLHDIAKPRTRAEDNQGRLRFFGHGTEGAETAAAIMERLRFSSREIKLVTTMVKHHLRPGQLSHGNEPPSHRAIYRYFRDTGEASIDILFLSMADHLAARGPNLNLDAWQEHTKMVSYLLDRQREQAKQPKPGWFINGNDLINIFGLRPGPEIGEILEQLHEAQAAGELADREAALTSVKKLLADKHPVI
ncbi:MAG: HD domain-containing protein [Chloroflexota bacterium]